MRLPPTGLAESRSSYVHVSFERPVETWVRLASPPVEGLFDKTFHCGHPKFAQGHREVTFESDGCALLAHAMPWHSGVFLCELKVLTSTEIQGSYIGLYFLDEPTEPSQRTPNALLTGYPGCNGASWGWAGTGAHRGAQLGIGNERLPSWRAGDTITLALDTQDMSLRLSVCRVNGERVEVPAPLMLGAKLKRGGAEAAHRAAAIWRRHGVVIFPALLSGKPLAALRERVAAAAAGNHTGDYTTVTRDSRHRVHKSLPVDEARAALEAIGAQLGPFLREALGPAAGAGAGEAAGGAPGLPLLESGFMVTSPGAEAQQFHRDVAPAVVSRSSLAVSCQVSIEDTAPTQGALEVVPGTQNYDPRVTDRERLGDPRYAQLPVAVPAGTVTVYMLHTMHRGGANTHHRERPFYFFTLMGDGIAPPGLAYTMELDDIGRWQLEGDRLTPRAAG